MHSMSRARSAAVVALLATAAIVGVGFEAAADVHTRTIDIGQARRTYLLFTPASRAPAAGYPLVVTLHGGAGTAEQMMSFSRFNAIAAREGFAVAYPQGTGRRWNDGRVFRGRGETDADDVAFIRAVVADIGERGTPLDGKRIFAAGISNGGFMSFRLACEAADLFAAVAPVTATMPADLGDRCKPSAPMAVLLINGTADPLVPYVGGHVRTLFGLRGEIWSTDRTIAFWAERNRCAAPPETRALADRDSADGSRVIELAYARCAGARVRLLRIEGGGHTWPGGTQYLPVAWIGPTNRDIDASEVIWRFFKASAR
jgi:polyhydroxybutyrate depolymerase